MTADLHPYPEYKDSGLLWLGKVPAHWDLRRIKRFAQVGNGSTPARGKVEYWADAGVPWLNSGAVHQEMITKPSGFVTDVALRECHLPQLATGTVLVAITGQGKTRGAAALMTIAATINQHVAYIAPRDGQVSGNYLRYFLMSAYPQLRAISDGTGGTKGALTCEDVRQFVAAIPPPEEQTAIADYLDAHAVLVRKFIRNRRRLIAALGEQKQAIINHAVTRGLDPNVPLKPSGIDWLGEVPQHWTQRRLKFLVRNINEQTSSKWPDDVYIALEHVESWTGRIALPSDVTFDSQVKRFQPNDLLFGKLRPYLAKVTRPQVNGVCVGEFLVLRTAEPSIRPEFLEQKLRSKQLIDRINSSTFGAKMPRADWTFIGNMIIAYPPTHDEQLAILGRTSEQTVALSSAIERAQHETALIREYRARLIADVVTGKLDVRRLAPPPGRLEPDEPAATDADGGDDEEPAEDDAAERAEETADADD